MHQYWIWQPHNTGHLKPKTMKNDNFNLNGTINIFYENELLMGELQYRLLNLILTDSTIAEIKQELQISRQKAVSTIGKMNKLAPLPVVETEIEKDTVFFRISDFGMKLMTSYAQKEFELYMFLSKSKEQLNNSFAHEYSDKTKMTKEFHS
jgi:molybdate transport repressor ModE-like protein